MKNIHLRVIIPQKLIRKVSKLVFEKTKLKKLFGTLLVIDSTPLKWKNLRLHMLYEARAKVLLSFKVVDSTKRKKLSFCWKI